MKSIVLVFVLLITSACGKYVTHDEMDKVKDRVTALEEKLATLSAQVSANTETMTSLSDSLASLNSEIETLRLELAQSDAASEQEIQSLLTQSSASYNNLLAVVQTLQAQTTALQTQQAALLLEERVVGIYDPCPSVASNSFKESLFLMSTGRYVAYFEDGGKRFLTVVKPGVTYRTTDSRACTFTIQ